MMNTVLQMYDWCSCLTTSSVPTRLGCQEHRACMIPSISIHNLLPYDMVYAVTHTTQLVLWFTEENDETLHELHINSPQSHQHHPSCSE
jgi:hypothetical protein